MPIHQVVGSSSPPSNPRAKDSYFDDGTNTGTGNPGWRYCVSIGPNVWADSVVGGGGGAFVAAPFIVVGNALNGDTAADCDILDIGNCAGIALALLVAGAGADVFIRAGVYDLELPGAPVARLSIPASTCVRGAGRQHTTIRTRTTGGDGRAFALDGIKAALWDIRIELSPPTVEQDAGAQGGIVDVFYDNCDVERVDLEFIGTWNISQVAGDTWWSTGIRASGPFADFRMVDCKVFDTPKLIYLGHFTGTNSVYIDSVGLAFIRGLHVSGGDQGLYLNTTRGEVHELLIDGFMVYGLELDDSDYSNIIGGTVLADGDVTYGSFQTCIILFSTDRSVLTDFAVGSNGVAIDNGVWVNDSDYNVIKGCRSDGSCDGGGLVYLDNSASDYNIILGCQSNGDGYTDNGDFTDIAHSY